MTPTPDQLKTAAREIRDLEEARLGGKLANTTVLNALTRALGLGQSFSAYAALTRAQTVPDTPITVFANLVVRNDMAETRDLQDIGLDDIAIATLAKTYEVEFIPSAHGFEVISIWRTAKLGTPDDLKEAITAEIAPLKADLEKAVDEDLAEGPVRLLVGTANDVVHVNFRHHDNDQVCTANVPRDAWAHRTAAGLSDEQALLLLAQDIEISPDCDAGDITVEDVFEDIEFYTGD